MKSDKVLLTFELDIVTASIVIASIELGCGVMNARGAMEDDVTIPKDVVINIAADQTASGLKGLIAAYDECGKSYIKLMNDLHNVIPEWYKAVHRAAMGEEEREVLQLTWMLSPSKELANQ